MLRYPPILNLCTLIFVISVPFSYGADEQLSDTLTQKPYDNGHENKETARLLLDQGNIQYEAGIYHQAERLYQLALMAAGQAVIRVNVINRYAALLQQTRRSQQALDLLTQLETFNPDIKDVDRQTYNRDMAEGLTLYSQLLIERAKANSALRPETAPKVLDLMDQAVKLATRLPNTEPYTSTSLLIAREAGRALEQMGYIDQAKAFYETVQPVLYQRFQESAAIRRTAWDVMTRHGKLIKSDTETQIKYAEARANEYLQTFPVDSQPLMEPLASLALTYHDAGRTEEARKWIDNVLTGYAKPIANTGICYSGLENLYADNLIKLYSPETLLRYADVILTQLLIANAHGFNAWQSHNCRMALYTIMAGMERLQGQFSPENRPKERALIEAVVVLATQLHQFSPAALSLALKKIKREAANKSYSKDIDHLFDIGERQRRLQARLRGLLADNAQDNHQEAVRISGEIDKLSQDFIALQATLTKKYSGVSLPQIPYPVHPYAVQQQLADDEAVILWAVEDYESLAVIITKIGVQIVRLPVSLAGLQQKITAIRATLDQPDTRSVMDIRPFAMKIAHELYLEIFAPLESALAGKKRLHLLPSGPLAQLPFEALPTHLPAKEITSPLDFARYRSVDWLGNNYVMNYQPSLNNLHSQLATEKPDRSGKEKRLAYAGFGNPVMTLPETEGALEAGFSAADVAEKIRQRAENLWRFMGDNTLESLRALPPLPRTEQQLTRIGEILGGQEHIYVGEDATLKKLNQLPLSRFETLVFATHGLMAGQNTPEPGLVMSPVDDDYSTAILDSSTIAELDLDADRVILSACNTGALGDDNGLASLSTAFFYAGARSLLVSHWSTEQTATTTLIVSLFEQLKKQPGQGLSSALRRAAHDLRDNNKNILFAHPMFWAPFVTIGQDHSRS